MDSQNLRREQAKILDRQIVNIKRYFNWLEEHAQAAIPAAGLVVAEGC